MNSITNNPASRVSQDSLGIELEPAFDKNGGDGALASLNSLIARMQKIGIAMRDLEREFSNQMQKIVCDKQLLTMNTKLESIDQVFKASLVSAGAKILGGVVNMFGASTGSQVTTTGTAGFDALTGGVSGMASAQISREAEKTKLLGDFQEQTLDSCMKSLTKTLDRATEASRQMLDVTREIVALHDRLTAAVKL